MTVAFAPIVAFLRGLSSFTVPWETLLLSAAPCIVAAGQGAGEPASYRP